MFQYVEGPDESRNRFALPASWFSCTMPTAAIRGCARASLTSMVRPPTLLDLGGLMMLAEFASHVCARDVASARPLIVNRAVVTLVVQVLPTYFCSASRTLKHNGVIF